MEHYLFNVKSTLISADVHKTWWKVRDRYRKYWMNVAAISNSSILSMYFDSLITNFNQNLVVVLNYPTWGLKHCRNWKVLVEPTCTIDNSISFDGSLWCLYSCNSLCAKIIHSCLDACHRYTLNNLWDGKETNILFKIHAIFLVLKRTTPFNFNLWLTNISTSNHNFKTDHQPDYTFIRGHVM